MLPGCGLLFLLFATLWNPIALHAPSQPLALAAPEYQLLTNSGMEAYQSPYGQYDGVNCQVASGWNRFSYDGPEPCFMDTRVFASSHLGGGWVEKIEGSTSQMLISADPYAAGLWQRVAGLTPGVGYGFHAAMLTIFQTSAGDPDDGTMIKQVGIDPTGGTDPQASTIVWSEPDDHDLGPWDLDRRVAAYAQGTAVTVFIRVTSPYDAGPPPYLNQSFLDSAILAQTPTVTATSPAQSESTSFVVRWDNAVAAPGVKRLKGYDVQVMDKAEGIWHDWITWTPGTPPNDSQATFTGERGHTYRFRARVWQKYLNGAHLHGPYRPEGDTQTYIQGPELFGHVWNNEGHPTALATVAIAGTPYAATSGAGGYYRILPPPLDGPRTITISHPVLLSPPPVHGVAFGLLDSTELTWTLRPPDDALDNGGFEAGLDGWSVLGPEGVMPTVVTDPVHTGNGALAFGGDALTSFTTGVTQTVILTHSWEPALSFWYRADMVDAGDVFNVLLTADAETANSTLPAEVAARSSSFSEPSVPSLADTRVFTPSLAASGWQHLALYPVPEDYFTGTVTIHFQLWDDGDSGRTVVHLDEVSLGRTSGGPFRGYLPFVMKEY